MYKEEIEKNIANYLKSGDNIALSVWRSIKTEFTSFITAKAGNVITDDVEFKIISKMVSQRKDSYEQYKKANREDLANIEKLELDILQGLLPSEPSDDDIKNTVISFINNYRDCSNSNPTIKNMKECMFFVKSKYPTANGGVISKFFKENI